MKKIFFFIIIIVPLSVSQDLLKDYEPPKVIEGSNLTFNADGRFYTDNDVSIYRSFNIGISPELSKFRYSDKLNYLINLETNTDYHHYYSKSYHDTNVDNTFDARIEINGAINYYLGKKSFYTGLNAGSITYFRTHNSPYTANYAAPLIGYGKIINAVEVTRAHFFEQVLKDEKVIKGNLSYKTRKYLVELFDKRNNREFIYKFKEDDEIEFFSQIEGFLKDKGVIKENMSAIAVLRLYQTLVNNKYLVYPKHKGYQIQLMFFYPFGTNDGYDFKNNPEILISGIYGIPLNIKTQLSLYGYFSKVIKVKDNNYHFFPFKVYNIFPLSIEKKQLDYMRFNNTSDYSTSNQSSETDYYFGTIFNAYYNISDFFGLRGYVNSTTFSGNDILNSYFQQGAFLDYGIISKTILSAGIISEINFKSGSTPTYGINGSVKLSYIIF